VNKSAHIRELKAIFCEFHEVCCNMQFKSEWNLFINDVFSLHNYCSANETIAKLCYLEEIIYNHIIDTAYQFSDKKYYIFFNSHFRD